MAYRNNNQTGSDTLDRVSNSINAAVQTYSQQKQMAVAKAVLNDPDSTPIQKAMALAQMGHEKIGSDVYKGSLREAETAALNSAYDQGGAQSQQNVPQDYRNSGSPNIPGATPPIRDAGDGTVVQPGAEGTGSPTQPGFSVNGPQNASRNPTALNQTAPNPNMSGTPEGMPQNAPAPMDVAQEAAAMRNQAGKMNIIRPGSGNALLSQADALTKEARAEKIANQKQAIKDKEILLEIHKSEKKAYDELEAEGVQAKKTSRARAAMIDQLATGKLDPKNARNLFANMFKGSPLLEGLFTTPEREVFKSAGVTQFEGMKDIFGVRLSDADLAVAATKVMDPTKPVEANLAIAKFWDFADKMKIEEANIAREVKKENGGFLPINWREQVHDKMSERFGDEAEQIVKDAANEGGSKELKIMDGKIAIIAPDGKRKLIPQEQLKQALLSGGIPE